LTARARSYRHRYDHWNPRSAPNGVTAESDGIAIGETGGRVDAYIDFLCPFCRQFEAASGDVRSGRRSFA
jgi:hypothetical protein